MLFKQSMTGAYATIEQDANSCVPVVVYRMTAADEARLDRFEGYPKYYYKREFFLPVWNLSGRKLKKRRSCIVYIMHAKPILRVYGNGEGNVYIGDQVIQILQNDGYIDLNCETHNAYDASGFCNGYVKSEDFPDLKPGKNHIAWSGNISRIEITPRWWTL